MSFAHLHKKLDLNVRPETLDAQLFVPGSDVEFDAPGYLLAVFEGAHDVMQRLAAIRLPFFDSAVFICSRVEGENRLWLGGRGGSRGRLNGSEKGQGGGKISRWGA